jgi:hypothetical protein
MTEDKSLQGLALLCTFGALCSAAPLAADVAQPAPAGAPTACSPAKPNITDVQFLELSEAPPVLKSVPDGTLTSKVKKMQFILAIMGENFSCTTTTTTTSPDVQHQRQDPGRPAENHEVTSCPRVQLQTQDPGRPIENQEVRFCSVKEIDVYGKAPVGTVITSVKVTTGGCKETPTPAGKETSRSGKEMSQDGKETNPAAKETNPGVTAKITSGVTATITDHTITIAGREATVSAEQATITGNAKITGATAMVTDHGTTISGAPDVKIEQATKQGDTAAISVRRTANYNGKCTPSGKDTVDKSDCNTATSPGLTISIKPSPPESGLQEFGIKFEHQQSKEFPNLHSLLVTKQSGDAGVGFDANPNHMSVDLEPTGATDLRVMQSNEEAMELHFVAAADYVPTNVVITVYDSSDLDYRSPLYVGKAAAASKAPATDPNAPAITSVETVFLDRHEGNGRIRIYGKGFGNKFEKPPYSVDDFLCDCLERPPLALPEWERFRTCGTLSKDLGGQWLSLPQRKRDQAKGIERDRLEQNRMAYCGIEPDKYNVPKSNITGDFITGYIRLGSPLDDWVKWQCGLGISVGVNSRNPDNIRIDKVAIININDEMIDVYFEFTRHYSYAWPFRLASVDVTIPGTEKKVEQLVTSPSAKATGEVDAATPKMVHLSSVIGQKPDENLTYRYTVLSYGEVQQLLGDGVADNFTVIDLAVVNEGPTKVAIPLAGMQAEIEWLYGRDKKPPGDGWFLEGPPTLPPVPMGTVSAYFGASKKATERRVKVFNVLGGITTLVGALIPFAGIGLKDAEVVFSSGFIPGLQHAWVDISDQQLQNLTTLSWQTSETLAANGGSMQKLIYIQRGEQFKSKQQDTDVPPKFTLQQMADIMGLEITGYEVPDSAAKLATPAGKAPTTAAKKKTSTSTTTGPSGKTTVSTSSESAPPP